MKMHWPDWFSEKSEVFWTNLPYWFLLMMLILTWYIHTVLLPALK